MWGTRTPFHAADNGLLLARIRRLQRLHGRTLGVRCVLESFVEWCRSLLSPSGVSHLLSFIVLAGQIALIDLFLVRYAHQGSLMTLVIDIPLLAHVLWFWREESAHRAAPSQWLSYSWVHAAKVVILFCRVMPRLPVSRQDEEATGQGLANTGPLLASFGKSLYTPTMLANLLLITPVFYALLMFRTSKAIFGPFSNRITVDLLMHYDMLWHVVIDMVDQVDMFYNARLAEWVDNEVWTRNETSLMMIQTVIPFLLFLSMTLQAQALPGVMVDHWHIPDPPPLRANDSCPDLGRAPGTSTWPKREVQFGIRPGLSRHATARSLATLRERPSTWSSISASTEAEASSPPVPPRTEVRAVTHLPSAAKLEPLELPVPELGLPSRMLLPEPQGPARPDLEPLSVWDCDDDPEWQGPLVAPAPPTLPYAAADAAEQRRRPATSGQAARPRVTQGPPRPSVFSPVDGVGPRPSVCSAVRPVPTAGPYVPRGESQLRDRSLRHEKHRRRRLQAIVHLIERQSIIIARKRSAVVSIFFVDVPFMAVRALLAGLLGQTYFSALGMKNAICIVLNVVQYTLVRIASRESTLEIQRQLAAYYVRFHRAGPEQEAPSRASPSLVPTCSEPLRSPDILSMFSTPQLPNEDSPFGPGLVARAPTVLLKEIGVQEKRVRKEMVRTTSVCVHFWALFVAFGSGLLLARGADSFQQFVEGWVKKDEQP